LRRAVESISQLPEEESHQWKRAMYYLVLLIYHRRPQNEHEELREIVGQSIKEKRRRKEVENMSQTMAEKLIQEGKEQGEKRGLLKAKREAVLKIMQIRFDGVEKMSQTMGEKLIQEAMKIGGKQGEKRVSLKTKREYIFKILVEIVEQGIKEERRREEVEKKSQTIAEKLIQEGMEIGEKKGEKRGEKRGSLKTKREYILKIMQIRFDSVPPSIVKKIKSMRSMKRLDVLLEKAVIANSISEIKMD